jgi:hypothetical protein
MIQDVHVLLNLELSLQNQPSTRRLFSLALGWNSREKIEHSFVWGGNLDTSESRSKLCWKLWNVAFEKMSWTDRVRNVEVLYRVEEERNILQTIKQSKGN